MKVQRILIIFFAVLLYPIWASSDSLPQDLQKLGQGHAYYLKFIKVYEATLFGEGRLEETGVLSSEVSKCLHLVYSVNLSQENFVEAANTVLSRQFTAEQLASVQSDIDKLHQGYQDVKEGDSYTLCYDRSSSETTLAYNGARTVTVAKPDFAEVYFSIWLGDKDPLDKKLRDQLLSGVQGG